MVPWESLSNNITAFVTCDDNQSGVLIQAFLGERVTVEDSISVEESSRWGPFCAMWSASD